MNLNYLFGLNKVSVIAGDIPLGDYTYEDGLLINSLYPTLPVVTNLKSIKQETLESAKNWLMSGVVALAAILIFHVLGLLALLLVGNRHKVCASLEFKSGQKLLAVMDLKIYQEMLKLVLTSQ